MKFDAVTLIILTNQSVNKKRDNAFMLQFEIYVFF